MDDWGSSERRGKRRYGLKGCSVSYKKGGLLSILDTGSPKYLVLNVSEGGLHFIAKDDLKLGKTLQVCIEAPGLEDGIRIRGKVAWCQKSKEHDAFRVGIEFRGMSRKASVRLRNMLDNAVLDKIDITTRLYLKEIERL